MARRARVTTKAVRYYESVGLLDASRLTNGYRDFTDRDVRLVEEIRDLIALGVTAEQARPFVDCLVAGNASGHDCPESLAAVRMAIRELDERLGVLSARREALATLLGAAQCNDCEVR